GPRHGRFPSELMGLHNARHQGRGTVAAARRRTPRCASWPTRTAATLVPTSPICVVTWSPGSEGPWPSTRAPSPSTPPTPPTTATCRSQSSSPRRSRTVWQPSGPAQSTVFLSSPEVAVPPSQATPSAPAWSSTPPDTYAPSRRSIPRHVPPPFNQGSSSVNYEKPPRSTV